MHSLNILIIEDELITAMDLQQTLEEAGHRITAIACTFQEALTSVKKHPPDLALIDIQLEGSIANGIDTAHALLTYHRMPIIYLTANAELTTFNSAKATAPAAYMLKPFRHDELKLQIELGYYHFKAREQETGDSATSSYLYWPMGDGYEKVNSSDVIYIQADGAYAKAYLIGTENPYHISTNLSHLTQYFPWSNFYRLSRSILINLNYLNRLEHNYLYLAGQKTPIQIPKANRKELLKRLTVVRTK